MLLALWKEGSVWEFFQTVSWLVYIPLVGREEGQVLVSQGGLLIGLGSCTMTSSTRKCASGLNFVCHTRVDHRIQRLFPVVARGTSCKFEDAGVYVLHCRASCHRSLTG